jgi:hypothetical protein
VTSTVDTCALWVSSRVDYNKSFSTYFSAESAECVSWKWKRITAEESALAAELPVELPIGLPSGLAT